MTEASIFTDEWNNSYLRLTLTIPGVMDSYSALCHPWTLVDGVDYSTDYDTALTRMQSALPLGTNIQFAEEDETVSVVKTLPAIQRVAAASYQDTGVAASVSMVSNAGSPAVGTVYAGVYSRDGILKGMASVPGTALSGNGVSVNVPVTVTGVSYAEGDYLQAFFWDEDCRAITNTATAKIQ